MLLPTDRLLASLGSEFNRLRAHLTDGEASAAQSIGTAFRLLSGRESGDVDVIRVQIDRLQSRLLELQALVPADAELRHSLEQLNASLAGARQIENVRAAEGAWRDQLTSFEALAHRVVDDAGLDPTLRTRIAVAVNGWEIEDLNSPMTGAPAAAAAAGTDITADNLTAYLRERFADSSIAVPMFRPLAGGFGKQTYLFDVTGRKFFGSYVLRRDLAEPVIDNDCHRIELEYALIRAVHQQRFPAPDALWVDTVHAALPGGDFLVMRRAPGAPGGSVFNAKGAIPADLVQTLVKIMVRLHALPPMAELATLTESLNAEVWNLPLERCVRRYIENFRTLYDRELHLPSAALSSLFGWLLQNVPPMQGKPVLLHGDIGFHNFLFDDGRLSAVLDWEFGHLGDPAEDLAYACNTLGAAVDVREMTAEYRRAGGADVSAERIRFFRIWGHVRNACASNLIAAKFAAGRVDDLKLAVLPHVYIPQFLGAAIKLIEEESQGA
jgi:aminoglycoside phosphotransferase (APT) family kinase protein